jgi:hypothetical protein
VDVVELGGVGQDRGAANPPVPGPRRGQLGDQREARVGREGTGRIERLRHRRLRAGHADLAAQLMQRVLACHLPGEIPRRVREQELLPQHVAVLGQEDRARVVGRHQHGWLSDPLGQPQQSGLHPLHVVRVGLPEAAAPKVTRTGRGRPGPLVHPVDGHAPAPQAADDAQAAVVHDVRIELQHHRGRSPSSTSLHAGHQRTGRVNSGTGTAVPPNVVWAVITRCAGT